MPNVSTTFRWNGSEVASIAKQGAIYIRSLIPLPDDDYDDSSETENEVGSVYLQCQVYFLIHLQVQVIVYIIQVYCIMYV